MWVIPSTQFIAWQKESHWWKPMWWCSAADHQRNKGNQYFWIQISLYTKPVKHRSRIQSSSKTAFQYLLRKRWSQTATRSCFLSRFSLGFYATSKNRKGAESQALVGGSGLFWSTCCRKAQYVPSYSCSNVLSPCYISLQTYSPQRKKWWKDEVI